MAAKILSMVLITLFGILPPLIAADIGGEWHAEISRGKAAPIPTTFDFEVDGNRLTGAMLYLDIEEPILDGKVEDDRVSFKIFDDTTRTTFSYKGKIVGDTIRFRVVANRGRYSIIEFTATRVGSTPGSPGALD